MVFRAAAGSYVNRKVSSKNEGQNFLIFIEAENNGSVNIVKLVGWLF